MKHRFQSAASASGDPAIVDSTKWNDTLIVGITAVSINTFLNSTHDCIKVTAGVSGVTITLPTSSGVQGQVYKIIKVDAAVGNVTIATTSSQTINGVTTYVLTNQWQFIEVVADETSNWIITNQN